ncbi:MAG: hypothetical protein OEY34_08665 [Cyclobacteriaceae bacterium]|nr:hypothetical protein [Cyclobacteriaceae bacterium]
MNNLKNVMGKLTASHPKEITDRKRVSVLVDALRDCNVTIAELKRHVRQNNAELHLKEIALQDCYETIERLEKENGLLRQKRLEVKV